MNLAHHQQIRAAVGALPHVPVEPVDWRRAADVQELLAKRGQHRSAGLADLLLAAGAERCGLAVLHDDADFDLIAAVTGQVSSWVVPRGSLHPPPPYEGSSA